MSFLTQVIFVASRSDNDPMLSFMMPFNLLTNCTVEQPVFGANYIKGTVQAAPDGECFLLEGPSPHPRGESRNCPFSSVFLVVCKRLLFLPPGGWEGSTPFKIVFRKGGAIDFAQLMAKAAAAGEWCTQ